MDERKEPIEESAPGLSPEDTSPDPQMQRTPMTDEELDRLAAATFNAAFDNITHEIRRQTHRLSDYAEQLRASVSEIRESLKKIDTFCTSDAIKEWEKVFSGVQDCFDHSHLGLHYVAQCIDRVNALLPALGDVIAAYKHEKGLSEISLEDFLGQTGVIPNEDFTEIIRKAREELHMSPTEEDDTQEITLARPALKLSPVIATPTYGLLNDKTVNELLRDSGKGKELDGQIRWLWSVDQTNSDLPENIPVSVALTYMGNDDELAKTIKTSKPITGKDQPVIDAIATIIYYLKMNGCKPPYVITPQEIWRKMNGVTGSRKNPNPQQVARIRATIDKLRFTMLYMNYADELDAMSKSGRTYKIDDDRLKKGYVETYYFKADYAEAETANGHTAMAYKFEEEPFMITYNRAKGHLLFYEYDWLDTSDTVRDSEDGNTPAFRRYLMQQIKLMYGGQRNNHTILYDTIYLNTDIKPPAERLDRTKFKNDASYTSKVRTEAKGDRDTINGLLQSWTNKGKILGYEPVKKGRSFAGVKILLNPQRVSIESRTALEPEKTEKKQ